MRGKRDKRKLKVISCLRPGAYGVSVRLRKEKKIIRTLFSPKFNTPISSVNECDSFLEGTAIVTTNS